MKNIIKIGIIINRSVDLYNELKQILENLGYEPYSKNPINENNVLGVLVIGFEEQKYFHNIGVLSGIDKLLSKEEFIKEASNLINNIK